MSKGPRNALGTADNRPRIYVRAHGLDVGWSHGPDGRLAHATGIGAAVEAALSDVDERPAVIFWMGRERHGD